MPNKILTTVFALYIVTVFAYANMAKAQIVEDGLISYWTFNNADIDGDTVKDVWGNNHGTIEGKPEIVKGHLGEALEFQGQPDRVVVSNHESLALSDKFTVEAWAKVNEFVTNAAMVSKGTGSGYFMLGMIEPDGFKVRLNDVRDGNSQGQYTGLFDVDRWYHLAMVVDGRNDSGLKLYVDGELIKPVQNNFSVGDIVCPNNLYIGFEERNTKWYIGVIDEVRIYDRALDNADVQMNFASQVIAVEYRFDKLSTTWAKIKKAQ